MDLKRIIGIKTSLKRQESGDGKKIVFCFFYFVCRGEEAAHTQDYSAVSNVSGSFL